MGTLRRAIMSAPLTMAISWPRAAAFSHLPRFFLAWVMVRVCMESLYSLSRNCQETRSIHVVQSSTSDSGKDWAWLNQNISSQLAFCTNDFTPGANPASLLPFP